MEHSLAQQAYHTWLASLYGSADIAFYKGVKTWDNLPDKAKTAWEVIAACKNVKGWDGAEVIEYTLDSNREGKEVHNENTRPSGI